MKLVTAAIILALSTAPALSARADQYDCIFKWTDAAAAKADAAALAQTVPDEFNVRQWATSHVIPDLQVWRASQDTTDAEGNVIHLPLLGWFALISADRVIPELRDDPALQVCINRDKMNAGITPFVVKSNVLNGILQDIRFAPIYMGANFHWGNLQ